MLVLTRKPAPKNPTTPAPLEDTVLLRHRVTGETLTVKLVRAYGAHSIRLGFEAGDDWNIIRGEIDGRVQLAAQPPRPAEAATA